MKNALHVTVCGLILMTGAALFIAPRVTLPNERAAAEIPEPGHDFVCTVDGSESFRVDMIDFADHSEANPLAWAVRTEGTTYHYAQRGGEVCQLVERAQ